MTGKSTQRWRRSGAALDGVSTLLHNLAVRIPAAVVMALVSLVLATVFAPGAATMALAATAAHFR